MRVASHAQWCQDLIFHKHLDSGVTIRFRYSYIAIVASKSLLALENAVVVVLFDQLLLFFACLKCDNHKERDIDNGRSAVDCPQEMRKKVVAGK